MLPPTGNDAAASTTRASPLRTAAAFPALTLLLAPSRQCRCSPCCRAVVRRLQTFPSFFFPPFISARWGRDLWQKRTAGGTSAIAARGRRRGSRTARRPNHATETPPAAVGPNVWGSHRAFRSTNRGCRFGNRTPRGFSTAKTRFGASAAPSTLFPCSETPGGRKGTARDGPKGRTTRRRRRWQGDGRYRDRIAGADWSFSRWRARMRMRVGGCLIDELRHVLRPRAGVELRWSPSFSAHAKKHAKTAVSR